MLSLRARTATSMGLEFLVDGLERALLGLVLLVGAIAIAAIDGWTALRARWAER